MDQHTATHPVLACASTVSDALKDVADVDPVFMRVGEQREALLELARLEARLTELRLRVMAAAGPVAAEDGARDVAAWLAHTARLARGDCRRDLRLATALSRDRSVVATALRRGEVGRAQAETNVRALDDLPAEIGDDVVDRAEARLVHEAASFGPRSLRVLGRRVLDVVAPQVAEGVERRALEREEEEAARRRTFLTSHRRGDGTTELRARVADAVADRLLGYLSVFTSPRRPSGGADVTGDRRPYAQRLGQAFGAFLESVDPGRLPLQGGDATTVVVTVGLAELRSGLGVALVGDEPITAGEARRLACTAHLVPAVLGGASEVLDLGRRRRLYSPGQRRAMAVRDRHCRAEGCDVPAAWCEAHHASRPWAAGGRTDLADGLLLCSWHHHRAHDHRYDQRRLPSGAVRFNRRT